MKLPLAAIVTAGLVVGLCQQSLAAQEPAPAGKRVALLVGVNKYDKRLFNDLSFAERDVEELAAILEKGGYDVHLLTGRASGAKRATLKNIPAMLVWSGLIVVLTVLGFATLLAGMIVVAPLLGHATWHAYRDLVR